MEALLLAGGFGTRLAPLTNILPKCLMPIHGRPLLGLWLEMLQRAGTTKVFINLHYLAPMVEGYVLNSPYRSIVEFYHEPELLGTAGTLRGLKDKFSSNDLMVVHADNLSVFDAAAYRSAFESRPEGCHITMMTFTTDEPQSCGIVTLDQEGRIIHFAEKPTDYIGNHANGAVYLMHLPDVMPAIDACPMANDISTEILPLFIGKMNGFHNHVYHRDIGNVPALCAAQKEITQLDTALELIDCVIPYWSENKARNIIKAELVQSLIHSGVDAQTIEYFTIN